MVLVFFGVLQLAVPYWLMARGLRVIGPAEAGTLTLLEPMLNPVWTYLISGERPQPSTFVGGAIVRRPWRGVAPDFGTGAGGAAQDRSRK